MAQISEESLQVVYILREAGVLVDMTLLHGEGNSGQAVCMCSDGDQFTDAVIAQVRASMEGGTIVRPHTFALHGGALVLSPTSGLYNEFRAHTLLHEHFVQAESPDLKGIDTAHLSIHTPCGAAAMVDMPLIAQIWHLYWATLIVEAIDTNNELVPSLHVDYGENPELMALRHSDTMEEFVGEIGVILEDLSDRYPAALVATLLRLPLDTHRRRTYRVDLEAFLVFWNEQGNDMWGHLFREDPRRLRQSVPVPEEDLEPARMIPPPVPM